MQVWLRLLVIWCIAIALPAQGVARVTLLHCGSSHQRMGPAAPEARHLHAGHDAGAAHAHEHDAAAGMDAAGHASVDRAETASDTVSDVVSSTCSSCASCCAGSALPSALPRMPQVPAAMTVFADEAVTVDAFASDGPDRPPRPRLV